ncbi:MAG: hypothetical protein Q4B71_03580 [Cardiobacteriaceae bacterium]|nr:hypothetical protein [Cardiobacteriaceae bacterium]
MQYNPDLLNPRPIFTAQEHAHLATLSQNLPLSILLSSPRNMEEIGIDFVHSSAQLEDNTKPIQTAFWRIMKQANLLYRVNILFMLMNKLCKNTRPSLTLNLRGNFQAA